MFLKENFRFENRWEWGHSCCEMCDDIPRVFPNIDTQQENGGQE